MNYTKQVLRGSAILFVFTVLAAFFGYIIRMVLTRRLSVEEYGLFYAIFTFLVFIRIFRGMGMNSALNKFIAEFNILKKYDKIKTMILCTFVFNIVITTLIVIALVILSGFLAENYFKSPLSIQILSILLIYFWVDTLIFSLKAIMMGFKKSFLFSFGDFALNLTVLLVIIFVQASLIHTLAWGYVVASVLLLIFYLFFLHRTFNLFKYRITKPKEMFLKLLRFGFPMLFSGLGYMLMGYTDTLMLTYHSLEQVGIYNAALPTSVMLLIFGRAIANIMFPVSSELNAAKKHKHLSQWITKIHKYGFLFILPFGLLLIAFPDLFLRVFFGPEYVKGALALQLLVTGSILYNIGIINTSIISAIGKPKAVFKIVFIAAIVNFILNWITIPIFGINGAAMTSFISYLLVLFLSTAKLSHFVKFKFQWIIWLKILLLGIAFLVTTYILKQFLVLNPFLEAAICIAFSSIVYILLAYLLKLINLKEIKGLVNNFVR